MRNPFSKTKTKSFETRNDFEKKPVPYFDIGAIGVSGILNERMIPIILADLSNRPDLEELIRIHQRSGAGDLEMQWGESGDKNEIRLILQFIRPLQCLAIFDFDIQKYGAAVDAIFRQRALYIQGGILGQRLSSNPNLPKVFCEIPSTGVEQHWEKLYLRSLVKGFRKQGFSRSEAKAAAHKFMAKTRGMDADIAHSLASYR